MLSNTLIRELAQVTVNGSDADFAELVNLVRDAQNRKVKAKRQEAKKDLRIGGKAEFIARNTGATHTIVINKICSKNVYGTELTASGQRIAWKVTATLLKAV